MLSNEQLERYSRHIILKEVGAKGQKKLLNAKVLIIGAGGLGAPAAMYLAAAGVGTIGIADADEVDLSNLQRQIIHSTQDVGKAKVQSAKETMEAINPDVKVIALSALLTTTMPSLKDTVAAINAEDFRGKVKVMVGGAPITDAFAKEIGADGYSEDAASAAVLAKALVA